MVDVLRKTDWEKMLKLVNKMQETKKGVGGVLT